MMLQNGSQHMIRDDTIASDRYIHWVIQQYCYIGYGAKGKVLCAIMDTRWSGNDVERGMGNEVSRWDENSGCLLL